MTVVSKRLDIVSLAFSPHSRALRLRCNSLMKGIRRVPMLQEGGLIRVGWVKTCERLSCKKLFESVTSSNF